MCLGFIENAGGRIRELVKVNRTSSEAHDVAVAYLLWCAGGPRPGACTRDSAAFISRRRADFLQLHFHDTRSDAESSGSIPPTARPTFSHEGDFNFTWGFYPQFRFDDSRSDRHKSLSMCPVRPLLARNRLGDAMVLVKYRFYRRDSPRGTTQASVTFGPKTSNGANKLDRGHREVCLPAELAARLGFYRFLSGGELDLHRAFQLQASGGGRGFSLALRTQGTQATRLGSDIESRFWLSYRPYESKNVAREWFIGPVLTWLHSQDDRIAGVTQNGSGGDVLLAGVTTYVGVRPGMHVWLGMDWDVAHSTGAMFMPVRRHISFGITQQFRLHLLGK